MNGEPGATMDEAFEPISLGYAYEVKYQTARASFSRKFPDGTEEDSLAYEVQSPFHHQSR